MAQFVVSTSRWVEAENEEQAAKNLLEFFRNFPNDHFDSAVFYVKGVDESKFKPEVKVVVKEWK